MILAGLAFMVVGKHLPLQQCSLTEFFLAALAQMGMRLWPIYFPLLFCSLGFGVSVGLINMPIGTLIQQNVPRKYLGQVNAVLNAVSGIGMPLTLLLISPLADRLPLPTGFGINATGMLAGGLIWWWAI